MGTFRETIEVGVPVRAVFDQLTHFESYPYFMAGVQQVTQVSDTETHWVTNLGGIHREFDAQLTECEPDQRVAWKAQDGPVRSEAITLTKVGPYRCQLTAELEADEQAQAAAVSRRLKADLMRFKSFVELQVGPVHAV
jgi:uncharacterized membrane protein